MLLVKFNRKLTLWITGAVLPQCGPKDLHFWFSVSAKMLQIIRSYKVCLKYFCVRLFSYLTITFIMLYNIYFVMNSNAAIESWSRKSHA